MQKLQEVLPSALFSNESNAGFFVGLDSAVPEFINTRLTPLPTTPRCVTPEDPFVWAVETVGESKSPLLSAVAIREELITVGDALFSLANDLTDAIPRSSERIDLGFRASCWRSSSCKSKDGWFTQDTVAHECFQFLHKDKLTFFSSSPQRSVSVSISAPFSVIELLDCDALELTPWSSSDADDEVVESETLFTSFMSRCTRDLQTDIAFWQYGMASWGLEPISRHKHIRKFLNSIVKVATRENKKNKSCH